MKYRPILFFSLFIIIVLFTPSGAVLSLAQSSAAAEFCPQQDANLAFQISPDPISLAGAQAQAVYPTAAYSDTQFASGYIYLPVVFRYSVSEMIYIPAGEFQMGCDPAHNGGDLCPIDELPLHTVYLDAFLIDKYEVTNGQYAQCVANNACALPYFDYSAGDPWYYSNPAFADYPVIWVSWYNAQAFCTWAGRRLPSEAEWEKAARGPTVRAYPWGDMSPDCTLANHGCGHDVSAVGSYPAGASPYGVHDMAGNVAEWVKDWYQSDYYNVSPYNNPTGPATGTYSLLRGGSWNSFSDLRSTYREATPG